MQMRSTSDFIFSCCQAVLKKNEELLVSASANEKRCEKYFKFGNFHLFLINPRTALGKVEVSSAAWTK